MIVLPTLPAPMLILNLPKGIDDLIRADFEAYRNFWFAWLLISTGIVALGLLLELPEIWHDSVKAVREMRHSFIQTAEVVPAVKLSVSLGWLLIVIGVAGEGVCEGFFSRADGFVQQFDEILLTETNRSAGTARASAEAAAGAASRAREQSIKATASASSALGLATGARSEADSFEKDIVSAKTQVADAESHLAEALRQAAQATDELNRLKTPRSLTHVPEFISSLEPFKGTEYVFVSVNQDEESIFLLRAIDGVLQKASWKRGKSAAGFPSINVYGKDVPDFSVPVGFGVGVKISTESPESLAILQSRQTKDLPQYLQAAARLFVGLSANLSPPQEDTENKFVNVEAGASTTVRIAIGRKP
jgi:ABC-type lipopolysaccharide export system ATPase subunit